MALLGTKTVGREIASLLLESRLARMVVWAMLERDETVVGYACPIGGFQTVVKTLQWDRDSRVRQKTLQNTRSELLTKVADVSQNSPSAPASRHCFQSSNRVNIAEGLCGRLPSLPISPLLFPPLSPRSLLSFYGFAKCFHVHPTLLDNSCGFFTPVFGGTSRGFPGTSLLHPIAATTLLFAQQVTIHMGKISKSMLFLPKRKNLEGLPAGYAFYPLVNVKSLQEAEIKHGRIFMLDTEGIVRRGAV